MSDMMHDAPGLIEMNGVSVSKHSDTCSFTILMLKSTMEGVPLSHRRNVALLHAKFNKR